jgi:hypothetical protein
MEAINQGAIWYGHGNGDFFNFYLWYFLCCLIKSIWCNLLYCYLFIFFIVSSQNCIFVQKNGFKLFVKWNEIIIIIIKKKSK